MSATDTVPKRDPSDPPEAVRIPRSESSLRVLSLKAEGEGFELVDASPMSLAGGSSRIIRIRRTMAGTGTGESLWMGQTAGALVVETDRSMTGILRIPVQVF